MNNTLITAEWLLEIQLILNKYFNQVLTFLLTFPDITGTLLLIFCQSTFLKLFGFDLELWDLLKMSAVNITASPHLCYILNVNIIIYLTVTWWMYFYRWKTTKPHLTWPPERCNCLLPPDGITVTWHVSTVFQM